MNYTEAKAVKLRAGRRKLSANLWLEWNNGMYHIRYYTTDIVTLHLDGSVILRHGGHLTKSTALLMSLHSPASVQWVPSKGHLVVGVGKKKYIWEKNVRSIELRKGRIIPQ